MEIEYQSSEIEPEPIKTKDGLKPQKIKAKWGPGIPRKMIVPALTLSVMASMALSGCGASEKKTDEVTPNALPTSTLVVDGGETQEAESHENETVASPEIIQPEEVIENIVFEGEAAELIEKIWNEYGIDVVAPTMVENVENLPWTSEEINILLLELSVLPKEFLSCSRSPKIIYLIKPFNTSGGAGGNFGRYNEMWINIPSDFDLNSLPFGMESYLFGSNRGALTATIDHEYMHAFMFSEENSEIMTEYISVSGRYQVDAIWRNDGNLVDPRGKSVDPVEDIATSFAVLKSNPAYLDDARLRFFANTEPFSEWKPFMSWMREFRPDLIEIDDGF